MFFSFLNKKSNMKPSRADQCALPVVTKSEVPGSGKMNSFNIGLTKREVFVKDLLCSMLQGKTPVEIATIAQSEDSKVIDYAFLIADRVFAKLDLIDEATKQIKQNQNGN